MSELENWYQVADAAGKPIRISDLTREQLLVELVKAIDAIEDLDEILHNKVLEARIQLWRKGG